MDDSIARNPFASAYDPGPGCIDSASFKHIKCSLLADDERMALLKGQLAYESRPTPKDCAG
jgi:hypothetical protein